MMETWELVRTARPPIIGEVRFVRKKTMATLEQIWLKWAEVIWDGREWVDCAEPAKPLNSR
jgi:hypothetical protein